MDVTDLVLTIENYRGLSEHNRLFSKEEFFSFLKQRGLEDFVDDIGFLLKDSSFRFDWKSLSFPFGVLEFRCCCDVSDLCSFLSGEFNDSLEKMEARGVLGLGKSASFSWDMSSELSPKVHLFLARQEDQYPLLGKLRRKHFVKKPTLDDVISSCKNVRTSEQSGFHKQTYRFVDTDSR